MTLTTKLSALTTAGIMVVIGVPMVTQSAMASGRAPAPVAATTQPKLVTGDITSTDQSGTNLFFGKKIVRNARGAIMKVDRTWPAAVPAPLPDVRADSSTRMLLGPVVDLAVNEHPEGVFYRIPALATASNGDLLASYDLRPGSAGDAPNPNSIVQRRSRDNGRTWGANRHPCRDPGSQEGGILRSFLSRRSSHGPHPQFSREVLRQRIRHIGGGHGPG